MSINVILILCIMIFFVYSQWYFVQYWWPMIQIPSFDPDKIERSALQDLNLKPGDLLLSRWYRTSDPYSRVPWWHHLSLVFRDEYGALKLADVRPHDSFKSPYGFLHVSDPVEKILRSKPTTLFSVRQITPPLTSEQELSLLQILHSHKKIQFDHYYVATYLQRHFGFGGSKCRGMDRKMACSTLLFSVLNQAGVTCVDIDKFPIHALHGQCNIPFTTQFFNYMPEIYVDKRETKELTQE